MDEAESIARRFAKTRGIEIGELVSAMPILTNARGLRICVVFELVGHARGTLGIWLDGQTGEMQETWLPMPRDGDKEPRHEVADQWPSWVLPKGAAVLVFLAFRRYQGLPDWYQPRSSVAVAGGSGVRATVARPSGDGGWAYAAGGGHWALAQPLGGTTALLLDLATGTAEPFTTDREPGLDYSISLSGRYATYQSYRPGGDEDIWVTELGHRRPFKHVRVERMPGVDARPVIGGDDRHVFWVRPKMEGKDRQVTCTVWMTLPQYPYDENDPPQCVSPVYPAIERLSPFPDGRRLLVTHEEGLDILDTATRKTERLKWPVMHDPDRRQGPPLRPWRAAVSPDGRQVAFEGRAWSGKPDEAASDCLYVCNLDGSGLQRVTPLTDDALPPYTFPATGKPAFEVKQ